MKTISLAAGLAIALGACATGPASAPTFDPAAGQWTGWVRFTEEFELYAQERQVRRPFARPCVSGALTRDAQRAAQATFGPGQQVVVTGRAVAWTEGQDRIDHGGTNVRNNCGGDWVILADGIAPLQ